MLAFNIKKVFKNLFIAFLFVLVFILGQIFYKRAEQNDLIKSDISLIKESSIQINLAYIIHGTKSQEDDPKSFYYKEMVSLLTEMQRLVLDLDFSYFSLDEKISKMNFEDFDKAMEDFEGFYNRAYKLYEDQDLEEVSLFHDAHRSQLNMLFERARLMREKEGLYINPYYASLWEGLGYGMLEGASIYLSLFFLVSIIIGVEFSLKDKGIDMVLVGRDRTYVYRILSSLILGLAMVLVLGLSMIVRGIGRGARLGSIFTPILYDVSGYGEMVLINPLLSFVKISFSLLLISLLFYIVYELFRRLVPRALAFVLTISSYLLLVNVSQRLSIYYMFKKPGLSKLFSLKGHIEGIGFPYVGLGLMVIFFFLLVFVNKKKTSLVFKNIYKNTGSFESMGLVKFEMTSLFKTGLIKSSLILLLSLALGLGIYLSKRKAVDFGGLASLERDKENAVENYILNTGGADSLDDEYFRIEMENRINRIKEFEEAYLNKDEDPKAYLKALKARTAEELGSFTEGTDPFLPIANLERIDYFIENDIEPDDSFGLVEGSLEPSLFQRASIFSLYGSKLYMPTESKGGLGLLISALETGLVQFGLLVLALGLSLVFVKRLNDGEINFLLTSPYSRLRIYLTAYLTRLGVMVLATGAIFLLIFISAYIREGLGQGAYPLLTYRMGPNASFMINFEPMIESLFPVFIAMVLFLALVIAFFMLVGLLVKNSNGFIIISILTLVIGLALAGFGLLGNFSLVNPFVGFDPLMTYKGGFAYINGTSLISYKNVILQNVIYTLVFLGLGAYIFKGGNHARGKKSKERVR